MRMRSARLALVAGAACLLAAGCAPPKTTVTGKVTYRGRPVPWGAVTLIGGDGIAHPGALQADGSFTIPGVPVGRVKIGVRSENPSPGMPLMRSGPAAPPPARQASIPAPVIKPTVEWVPIPDRYADPDRSGLTGEVREGQPLTIELV
jgi:hypothetical protein